MDLRDIAYLAYLAAMTALLQIVLPGFGKHIDVNYFDAVAGLQGLLFIGGVIESSTLRKMSRVTKRNRLPTTYAWTFIAGMAACLTSIALDRSYTATFVVSLVATLALIRELYGLQFDRTLNDALDSLNETLKKAGRP